MTYELRKTYDDDGTVIGNADTLTGAKDYALMLARDRNHAVTVLDPADSRGGAGGTVVAIAYPGGSLEEM